MQNIEESRDIKGEKVNRLEDIIGSFMIDTDLILRRLGANAERMEANAEQYREQTQRQIEEIRAEMAQHREHTDNLIAEIRAEMAQHREHTDNLIAEMRAEAVRDRRDWNKRWGGFANRMGTIVEDIITPSLRRMASEVFGCGEERFFAVRLSRVRSDDPGRVREFDAFYVGAHAVLLNESKTTARSEYARDFVQFLQSDEFSLYFPEYREMPVVPVFSSLQIPPNIVTYLTGHGIYAVGMSDEAMQVLNLEEVRVGETD